jgi:hypothetical protein
MDRPITEMPVVGHITAAEKAQGFMKFLIENYDASLEAALPELSTLLQGITHMDNSYFMVRNGGIDKSDEQKIADINSFLQNQLATALNTKFGRADLTVMDMVRSTFPAKPLYVNNHDNGISSYTEDDYFDTLPIDAVIGYQKWDQQMSIHRLRRMPVFTNRELPGPESK